MKSTHRRMSWQEFLDLPRSVGWKHEYYGGKVHITPAHQSIPLELVLLRRACPADERIQPVRDEDGPELVEPFVDGFRGTMDYCDLSVQTIRERALGFLAGFFSNKRGERLAASCLARSKSRGTIVGAALVRRGRQGPLLNAIFVRPRRRRTGIGTSLLSHVTAALIASGETRLFSRIVLGNEPSLSWHRHAGFRERPDWLAAGHRARIYHDELERRRRLQGPRGAGIAELERQANLWWRRYRRLDARFRRDPDSLQEWME